MVDTKYEFVFLDDQIILIDELHTCDSSRYWKLCTYESRFNEGNEPEKLDKDCVRDFVKKNCDPYNDDLPVIPNELIEKVTNVYNNYLNLFTSNNLDIDNSSKISILNNIENLVQNRVVILSGSESDKSHCEKICNELKRKDIISNTHYCSAHKNTRGVLELSLIHI